MILVYTKQQVNDKFGRIIQVPISIIADKGTRIIINQALRFQSHKSPP